MHPRLLLLLGLFAVSVLRLPAAEPAVADERMRTALKNATQQLQTVQSERDAAQAAQTALTAEKKELTDKYELVKKQSAADRAAAEKTAAAQAAQLTELKAQLAKLTAALEAAQTEGRQVAAARQTAEQQLGRLTGEHADLQHRLADRETRNLALFLLANEILTRYEEFGLGTALRAKEPFVGRTRAKLESLVEDYRDKLQEQRATP